MGLTRQQRRIARTIVRVGHANNATRKEIVAALETARVESNFSNPNYGDRDSVGWRQERSHYGSVARRRNVRGAARRFYRETAQAGRGKGVSAGRLAQSVQRSAFPGRYDQHKAEAQRLFKRFSGGAGGAAGGVLSNTTATVTSPKPIPGGLGFTNLLAQQLGQAQPPPVAASAPPEPAFSARKNLAMPAGYQQVASSPVSAAPAVSLADQLREIQSAGRAAGVPQPKVDVNTTRVRVPGGGGKAAGAKVKGELSELFWQGSGGINVKHGKRVPQGFVSGHTDHVHVAGSRGSVVRLGRLAQKMGLRVGENPHFGGVAPVHTSGSYHYSGRAIDVSGDPKKMRRFAHRVARIYGV